MSAAIELRESGRSLSELFHPSSLYDGTVEAWKRGDKAQACLMGLGVTVGAIALVVSSFAIPFFMTVGGSMLGMSISGPAVAVLGGVCGFVLGTVVALIPGAFAAGLMKLSGARLECEDGMKMSLSIAYYLFFVSVNALPFKLWLM